MGNYVAPGGNEFKTALAAARIVFHHKQNKGRSKAMGCGSLFAISKQL
jgi:hypothetical protein